MAPKNLASKAIRGNMIDDNLLRFNKEQRYLIADCETCHLNLVDESNLPWQWAWVDCTLDNVIGRENIYVKWPNLKVSKQAAFITGFSPEKIERLGQDPALALEKLDAVIYDPKYRIIIHNGLNFDLYIQNIHRNILGKPTDFSYVDRVIDTSALSKSLTLGIKPQKGEDLLAFQYRFINYVEKGLKSSIQFLCQQYDIPYDAFGAHDAAWDTETLRKLWLKMVYQLEI